MASIFRKSLVATDIVQVEEIIILCVTMFMVDASWDEYDACAVFHAFFCVLSQLPTERIYRQCLPFTCTRMVGKRPSKMTIEYAMAADHLRPTLWIMVGNLKGRISYVHSQ
jgi:hypothetical protein